MRSPGGFTLTHTHLRGFKLPYSPTKNSLDADGSPGLDHFPFKGDRVPNVRFHIHRWEGTS